MSTGEGIMSRLSAFSVTCVVATSFLLACAPTERGASSAATRQTPEGVSVEQPAPGVTTDLDSDVAPSPIPELLLHDFAGEVIPCIERNDGGGPDSSVSSILPHVLEEGTKPATWVIAEPLVREMTPQEWADNPDVAKTYVFPHLAVTSVVWTTSAATPDMDMAVYEYMAAVNAAAIETGSHLLVRLAHDETANSCACSRRVLR